jgi:hypothetical protein
MSQRDDVTAALAVPVLHRRGTHVTVSLTGLSLTALQGTVSGSVGGTSKPLEPPPPSSELEEWQKMAAIWNIIAAAVGTLVGGIAVIDALAKLLNRVVLVLRKAIASEQALDTSET